MVTTTRAERPVSAFCAERVAAFRAEREAGPRHLLEEALQQRRHVAQPERKEQHQVLRPGDVVLRRLQRRRQRAVLPLLLAAQQREVESAPA